jgi:hypothetical protein
MRLPHEDELRAVIQQRLDPELRLATEILDLGTSIFTSGRRITPAEDIDDFVVMVGLGLLAKACKQYRAVGAMVELGLGDVADSIARMMFESMLAIHFVLRAEVNLTRDGVPVGPVPNRPLTTRLRTSLYLANDAINGRRLVRGLLQTPGLENHVAPEIRVTIEQHATEWEGEIGEEWTARITNARGYAGVSVQHLAESLGFAELYPSVYRISSSGVHAANAASFIDLDDDAESGVRFSASSNTGGIANALGFASLMLTNVIRLADDRLKLGIETQPFEGGLTVS